ncbi:hypothetical protein AB1N83_009795, partial [Pleurotus pulmonarius]
CLTSQASVSSTSSM